MTRNAAALTVLLCLALVPIVFVATAAATVAPPGHLHPNDRAGVLGIGNRALQASDVAPSGEPKNQLPFTRIQR